MTRGGSEDRRLIRRSGRVLAACAVAALALATVGLHAAAGSALHNGGANGGISFVLGGLFALGALMVATRYRTRVRSTEVLTTALDRLRTATVAVLYAAAVLVPLGLILLHHNVSDGNGSLPPDYPTAPGGGGGAAVYPTKAIPTPARSHGGPKIDLGVLMLVLGTIAAAALIAAAIVVAVRLLRGAPSRGIVVAVRPPEESALEDEALADALAAGRSALAGQDARAAIIACYAAMEESLGQAGITRERADSPTDLLHRAIARDAVDRSAAAALTDLFREARFSTHAMDGGHLAAARRALDTIIASITEALVRQAVVDKAALDKAVVDKAVAVPANVVGAR